MRLKTIPLHKVPIDKVKHLVLDEYSAMSDILRILAMRDRTAEDFPGFAILAYEDDEIVGWLYGKGIRRNDGVHDIDLGVYVNSRLRRHGIGRRLVRHAISVSKRRFKDSNTIYIYPWDDASKSFFSNIDIKDKVTCCPCH